MKLCIRPSDVTPTPGVASLAANLIDEFLISPRNKSAVCVGSKRITVIRQRFQKDGTHFPHQHARDEQVYYVLAGRGRVRLLDRKWETGPGTVFYIPPSTDHEAWNLENGDYVNLLLGIDLSDADVAPDRTGAGPACIRPGDVKPIAATSPRVRNLQDEPLLSPNEGHYAVKGTRRISLLRHTYGPGGTHLPHTHTNLEQVYYIARGQARARLGDETYDATGGTAFYIPPNVEHEITNTGDGPLVNLLVGVVLDASDVG